MSAIPIGEWMYGNKVVMQADCYFIIWKYVMLDPINAIAEHMMDGLCDLIRFNPDVAFSSTVCTCPVPDNAKEIFMQA